jgi:hypothetical protein
MFNTTTVKTDITNEVAGLIKRTVEESFFLKFHQNSRLADQLFEPKPEYKSKPVKLVQMMLINEGYILAECVYI